MVQATYIIDNDAEEKPNSVRKNEEKKATHSDINSDQRTFSLEEAIEIARKSFEKEHSFAEKNTGVFIFNVFLEVGKYQTFLIILTSLCLLGSSIENTNMSYITPYAKCDLGLTLQQQGLLSAISYVGNLCTSHLWGFLADTWGRQKVLRVAAAGAFGFACLSMLAINTISMIALRFFVGAL